MDNFIKDLDTLLKKEYGHENNDFTIKQIDNTGLCLELKYNSSEKEFNTFKYLLEKSIKEFNYIDKVDFGSKDRKIIYIKCEFK